MKVKILTVQTEPIKGDIEANIKKVTDLLENSGEETADLIVLPEMWTLGWDCEKFPEFAENIFHSKVYYFLRKTAAKYRANIAGGSSAMIKTGERARNTCLFFDRKGKLLTAYDKYHLFSQRGESEGSYLQSGENAVLVKTDIGKIGLSICYDIRFPEMFRLYAHAGADFIINSAAWPELFFEEYVSLAKARAIENQTYFISCCTTGKINENYNFSGNSFVCDFHGKIVSSLDKEEGVLKVEIDTDEMKEYRNKMPVLKDTKDNYKLKEV